MISRRSIIKSVAAIPVAASLPAIAAVTAPPVTAVIPKPPAHPWQWWVTRDENFYYEGFDTRAEAVEYARKNEYPYIAECKQQNFSLEVEADDVLERLADCQYDLIGEGEFIETTAAQRDDLSERLTRVMYEWASDHKINLTAWSFGSVRNRENVDAEVGDDTARKDADS